MKFFIPGLSEEQAEERWAFYVRDGGAPDTSRRVYAVTYEHGGDRYAVKVGEPRQVYRRRTGPRGGYMKNAGHEGWATETGTVISGIVDARTYLQVWSFGPPFGGWANPSLIGRPEITRIEYFE